MIKKKSTIQNPSKKKISPTKQIVGQLELFYEISTSLASEPSLGEVLKEMFRRIGKSIGLSCFAIWLLDEKKENFTLAAHHLLPESIIEVHRKDGLKSTEGGPGIVFRTKKPYLMPDVLSDPKASERYRRAVKETGVLIRGILIFPLMIKREIIGTLNFFFRGPKKSISRAEFIVFYAIANQIASFIQNSRAHQELQERMKELEKLRSALMNMLEDTEEARKTAEEEKNKTQAIITDLADGLLVFDKENRLSLINPQAENLLNIKKDEIAGKSIPELNKLPILQPLADLLGDEIKSVFRQEIHLREKIVLEASTVSMMMAGEKSGSIVILHDITREKAIEKMKTEFVSLAAHQLRTPLSAIKWALKMLIDGDLGQLSLEQTEIVEKTYRSNERMVDLINDLLDVTRIEEGKYLFRPVLTGIEPILQFAVKSYQEEVKRRNIVLEFNEPKEITPKVMADVEKMRIAVQNLIDNAVKYTSPNGRVTVSLSYGKKELEVVIKDTGVGIPEDQKERIFSKFFRGSNVIKMETDGSGLGLFIAKNIIEAHGGKIWFESEEGRGTTFYFALPLG